MDIIYMYVNNIGDSAGIIINSNDSKILYYNITFMIYLYGKQPYNNANLKLAGADNFIGFNQLVQIHSDARKESTKNAAYFY